MTNEKNNMLSIALKDGIFKDVPYGTSLRELVGRDNYSILAAKVDNDIKELRYTLEQDCIVDFIDFSNIDGFRIYRRSICFVLIKAVNAILPNRQVVISHSISNGVYCEVKGDSELTKDEVLKIESKMIEIINADIPFNKKSVSLEEAKESLKKIGRMDRYYTLKYRNKKYVTVYELEGLEDYFYGYMVPSTLYLSKFKLKFYKPGLIILLPTMNNPQIIPKFNEQKKLFNIFVEYKNWERILGVDNVGELNRAIKENASFNLIRIAEALQEKKIAQIADMVKESKNNIRMILIAGPSSSGKTTFANRLAIQLIVNGLKPVTLSIDDYFVNRDATPKDEHGDYDFESLEALDLMLFNQHLSDLIGGKEIIAPIFNFPNGCRESYGRKLKIEDDQILVIEGIHGLNEKLTASIKKDNKFKIYVSALTSMNIDQHNKIPTTDTRLIRRIVRDFNCRGCNAETTIMRWPSVRRGEEKNIFPYQEEADIMFNSFLIFELCILKNLAEPLLLEINNSSKVFYEAKRLIEFLSYFVAMDSKDIPSNSIIREFIGDSCFY